MCKPAAKIGTEVDKEPSEIRSNGGSKTTVQHGIALDEDMHLFMTQ